MALAERVGERQINKMMSTAINGNGRAQKQHENVMKSLAVPRVLLKNK